MSSIVGNSLLYNRRISLQVTPYQATSGLSYGNTTQADVPLRLGFTVERKLDGKADKAKLSITNLSPNNRDALVKASRVVLSAGYAAKSGLVFQGFVSKVKSQASGPDVVTELECEDGYLNIQYAVVNRVYAESVSLAQILQDLAADLQLKLDGQIVEISPGVIKGIPEQTFARGMTLEGSVSHNLDLLLRPQYIDWTVQNGRLIIIPRFVTTSIEPCVILSKDTGMLDTPTFTEKGLVVSSLMNSDILPGRLLQIVSANKKINGLYKVLECQFSGDTHDLDWRVQCTCELFEGEVKIMPLASKDNFQKAVV